MIEFHAVTEAMRQAEVQRTIANLLRPSPVAKACKRKRKPWRWMTPLQRWEARQRKLRRMAGLRQKCTREGAQSIFSLRNESEKA